MSYGKSFPLYYDITICFSLTALLIDVIGILIIRTADTTIKFIERNKFDFV